MNPGSRVFASRLWLRRAAVLALVAAAAPVPASAQAPALCAGDAQQALKQGVELRRQERPDEALAAFTCARALGGGVRALINVALAEKALGRWLPAHEHLAEALAQDRDAYVQAHRGVLEQDLAEIKGHLATLEVRGAPPEAEVLIDGKVRGRLPLRMLLLPEDQTLQVRAPGYVSSQRQLRLQAGRLARETVELTPQVMASLGGRRRLGFVLAGGAALGLLLGAAAQTAREVLISRYNDDAQCLDPGLLGLTREQSCPELRGQARTAQIVAIVGWASGGALATAALGVLVPTLRERRLALVPGGPGLSLMGAF